MAAKGQRLKPYRPIKPLDPSRRLCPPSVPQLQLGKFTDIDGQLMLDFSEDEETGGESDAVPGV